MDDEHIVTTFFSESHCNIISTPQSKHEETTPPAEAENPLHRFADYNLPTGKGKKTHKSDRHRRDV